ncbi:phosphoribosylanthranilate isomerase [Desertivirga brevis]|uniref:phosphoribosylanthranilate isomerase n=1 Tax=Desertivirga brevis TaxID=2810310 RepID=UPI001A969F00|nr:phosphoribosylanthranilate isomerase [Pedobacter sp. SYSU D00873]
MNAPHSPKIKVCGMRDLRNIQDLMDLQPDYMGLIFYPPSKRYVDELAEGTLEAIPETVKITGVFVNASKEDILAKIAIYDLDALQLHGAESPELCKELAATGLEIIKAFGVDEEFDFSILQAYEGLVDYFLFDTKTKLHGGSGQTFNWDLLKGYKLNTPYFLSGGLDADNIEEALKLEDTRFYAFDLNSRFELEPALKDIDKLRPVFNRIKEIPA